MKWHEPCCRHCGGGGIICFSAPHNYQFLMEGDPCHLQFNDCYFHLNKLKNRFLILTLMS
jgi:hypothetical protein